jgi:hypothetical protein
MLEHCGKAGGEGFAFGASFQTSRRRGGQDSPRKLCVGECELTGKIAVGKEATMDEILDLLLHHEVVNL